MPDHGSRDQAFSYSQTTKSKMLREGLAVRLGNSTPINRMCLQGRGLCGRKMLAHQPQDIGASMNRNHA